MILRLVTHESRRCSGPVLAVRLAMDVLSESRVFLVLGIASYSHRRVYPNLIDSILEESTLPSSFGCHADSRLQRTIDLSSRWITSNNSNNSPGPRGGKCQKVTIRWIRTLFQFFPLDQVDHISQNWPFFWTTLCQVWCFVRTYPSLVHRYEWHTIP